MIPNYRIWFIEDNKMLKVESIYFPLGSPSGKDITSDYPMEIILDREVGGWTWRDKEGDEDALYQDISKHLLVIGNKYENPNMLKMKK